MKINIPIFLLASFATMTFAGDWPGWRGTDRTDVSTETGLLKEWPEGGPKQLWLSKEAGLGYSSFSVVDGRLFTMGAFEGKEKLLAFDAMTGEKLREIEVGDLLTNNWGNGPRSCPTVADGKVYALGGRGNLVCADPSDGKVKRSL
ncbi:uncharacterized protein METZ01_LOCUS326881, partial [marine metagenome]